MLASTLKNFFINPFLIWRRIFAKIELKTGIPTHFLSPTRLLILAREKKLLSKATDKELIQVGNYLLHSSTKLNENSVVYSLGIGTNIEFDQAIHNKFKSPVYMVDPTPKSLHFLANQKLPDDFKHLPAAVYNYDGEITFYPDSKPEDLDLKRSLNSLCPATDCPVY